MKRLNVMMIITCIFACSMVLAAGCNSADTINVNNQGSNPINSPVAAPYIYTYSSGDADNHNHTARVYSTAYSTPDAAGWSDTSTAVMDHSHTMALTLAELTAVNGGALITVTSSTSTNPSTGVSHSHPWTVAKGFIQASSTDENHSHNMVIANSDLANPPAGGMNYTTSTALNHSHTVTFTQEQLTSLNGNSTMNVTSGNATNPVSGKAHYHAYNNLHKPW